MLSHITLKGRSLSCECLLSHDFAQKYVKIEQLRIDSYVIGCYNEINRTYVRSGGYEMIREIIEMFEQMNDEQKKRFMVYLEEEILRIRQLSAKPPDHVPQ